MSLITNSSSSPNIEQINSSIIDFTGGKLRFEIIIFKNPSALKQPDSMESHFMHMSFMSFNKDLFTSVKPIPFVISLVSPVTIDTENTVSWKCELKTKLTNLKSVIPTLF
jgi:hypothetical protein